jgi:hypothetical protein
MTDRPWCGMCGGSCYRMEEHFGEILDGPPECDESDEFALPPYREPPYCAKCEWLHLPEAPCMDERLQPTSQMFAGDLGMALVEPRRIPDLRCRPRWTLR